MKGQEQNLGKWIGRELDKKMETTEFKEMFYVTIDTNIMWNKIMSFQDELVIGVYSIREFLIAVLKKNEKHFVTEMKQIFTLYIMTLNKLMVEDELTIRAWTSWTPRKGDIYETHYNQWNERKNDAGVIKRAMDLLNLEIRRNGEYSKFLSEKHFDLTEELPEEILI